MVSGKTRKEPKTIVSVVGGGNRRFWLVLWIEFSVTQDPKICVKEYQATEECLKLYRQHIFDIKVYECGIDSRGAEIEEVDGDWYPDVPKEG